MWGQVREVKNAPSPEVANLGTFGSIPVGHYTGTPEITVPLYTMKVGKLSLPIQASYHLANVKPHTPPTSLGIGWALSAGGYIARRVIGVQDEKVSGWGGRTVQAGFYFNHNKIKEIENSTDKSGKLQEYTHLRELEKEGWYELSADEFSFSFNGCQGTFFMDMDGQWRVVSDNNIIVEFDEKSGFITNDSLPKRFPYLSASKFDMNEKFFNKFTLITPDGTRYEFGGGNATEYSAFYYNQNPRQGDLIATCWRLSRITTVDKKVINFEYASDSYMCDIHYAPQLISEWTSRFYPYPPCRRTEENYGKYGYSGFLTMPARLIKISSDNESISFNYNRDESYGDLFLSTTQCLYWDKEKEDDDYIRHQYGNYLTYEDLDDNRFFFYMGIEKREKEKENREAIAKKLTQDYLSAMEIVRPDGNNMKVKFYYITECKRKLLSNIQFSSEGFTEYIESPIGDIIVPVNSESSIRQIPNQAVINGIITDAQESVISSKREYQYKFEYNLGNQPEEKWPNRSPLTFTDSWGYFSRNGYNSKDKREWSATYDYIESDYKIREPSEFDTEIFTLKSIGYPTGGKTELQYELNHFSKVFDIRTCSLKDSLGTAGGLRVRRLMNFDSSDSLLYTKEYVYLNANGECSGISKGNPCYYDRFYFDLDTTAFLDFYSFDDMNPYPLNFNTPDVGYSTVFEYLKDGNSNLLIRTKYQYTNYDIDANNKTHMDSPADYTAYVYDNYASAFFTSLAFERGKLVLKEVMDANGVVLERNTYDYVRTEGEPFSTVSQTWHYDYFVEDLFAFSYLYKTYANKYLMSVNKRQEKMNNGMYNTETRYEYADFGLPTRKTFINNLGEKHITDYWYSNESYRATSYVPHPWMKDKNIILPVEIIETLPNNNFYHIENVYDSTSIGVPYISQKKTRCISQDSYYGQNTHVNYTVEKADKFGNPIIWDENGVKTIMIWSNMGQNLVATIQNANYDEVKNALGIAPEKLSESKNPPSTLGSLRTKLSSALIYIYEYDKRMNLVRKTDPNGLVHRYLYDPLNRLTAEFRVVNGRNELVHSYKYNYFTNQ